MTPDDLEARGADSLRFLARVWVDRSKVLKTAEAFADMEPEDEVQFIRQECTLLALCMVDEYLKEMAEQN